MPTEPVAPSTVTVRTAGAAVRSARSCGLTTCITHHTMRPRAGASNPPRAIPIKAPRSRGRNEAVEPVHQAAMAGNELACVLGVELALDRGFREIAGLRNDRKNERHHSGGGKACRCRTGCATMTPPTTPATVPPIAPDQVLFGTDARHQLRPADGAADEIGRDVGQPDDHEQEQDRGEAEISHRAATAPARSGSRRIDQTRRRTTCGEPSRPAPRRRSSRAR